MNQLQKGKMWKSSESSQFSQVILSNLISIHLEKSVVIAT